ncbi:MAG: hypothetical protein Q8O89_05045 [Nanoarchaeota archaeon]|nr:hypothetical protein [Nanoarchaeota archaeon]
MKFDIDRKPNPNVMHYGTKDIDIAYDFSKKIYKEFGNFLRAIILFGAAARRTSTESGDVDILIIIDDTTMVLSQEVVEAYRIITEKLIVQTSQRLHITTIKFTDFWEYVKISDPIAINILRDGVALVDTGFFDPLQMLLRQGRIRPSREAMWAYYTRAPATLHNSKWHIIQATIDLYWAMIDASHAALMKIGEVPASPIHVPDLLTDKFVKHNKLEKQYVKYMEEFYTLYKKITHREIKEIKGEDYDRYHRNAKMFVDRMRKLIDEK